MEKHSNKVHIMFNYKVGYIFPINPLVPDAHYSERQDKPLSLQIQQLEVDLK